ncbi:MAG: M15 family metallopeptidase [Pyrinomonadaceae bacterium]
MRKVFLLFTLFAICLILGLQLSAQDSPPKETGKREARLIELNTLDDTIKLDVRYATENNFMGKKVYSEARVFLQKPAARAVVRVHKKLMKQGLGLVIYDGYRPWTITKLFWDTVTLEQRKFVADPSKGSKHNRGCAVDLGIFDLKTGQAIPMPSAYDEFSDRASPDYAGGSTEERSNRDLLRKLMEAEGYIVNPDEWWHFDYKDWEKYTIYDISFAEAAKKGKKLKGGKVKKFLRKSRA